MQKLTNKDIKEIKKLNHKLVKIEKKIDKLVKKEYNLIQKKLSNTKDKLTDWEFKVEIGFFNNKKELYTLYESYKNSFKRGISHNINNGENHNVASIYNNDKLTKQHHCWLLHSLYDDSSLTWKKILKIDSIWIDIKPIFQYEIKLK